MKKVRLRDIKSLAGFSTAVSLDVGYHLHSVPLVPSSPALPHHHFQPTAPPHPSPDQGCPPPELGLLLPLLRAPVPSAPFGPQAPTQVMVPHAWAFIGGEMPTTPSHPHPLPKGRKGSHLHFLVSQNAQQHGRIYKGKPFLGPSTPTPSAPSSGGASFPTHSHALPGQVCQPLWRTTLSYQGFENVWQVEGKGPAHSLVGSQQSVLFKSSPLYPTPPHIHTH